MSTLTLAVIELHPPGQAHTVAIVAEWDKTEGYRVRGGGCPVAYYKSARAAISAACGRATRCGANFWTAETI